MFETTNQLKWISKPENLDVSLNRRRAGGAFWLSPSSAALSNWTVRSGLHRATGMAFWADFMVDFMVLPRNFCSHACSLTPPLSNTWATVWLCVSNESWESSKKKSWHLHMKNHTLLCPYTNHCATFYLSAPIMPAVYWCILCVIMFLCLSNPIMI